MIQPGDIVLAEIPFTDNSSSKLRPALVLLQCQNFDDYLLAFISSSSNALSDTDRTVMLDSRDKTLGLKKISVIKLDKLSTINVSLIEGVIGHIQNDIYSEILLKLRKIFGETQ